MGISDAVFRLAAIAHLVPLKDVHVTVHHRRAEVGLEFQWPYIFCFLLLR